MGAVGFGIESVVPAQWSDIPLLFQKYSGFYMVGVGGGLAGVKSKDSTLMESKKIDVQLWDWKSGCLGECEAASGESSNPWLQQN